MGQFSDNNVDEEIDIFNFASVIRNRKAKGLYFPNNTVINDVGGTIYAEIMISALVAATKPILTITNTDDGILGANNTTGNTLEAFDGTNTATIDGFASGFGIYNKVALRWGSGKMRLFVDGVGGTEADYAGTWVRSITRLQIGPTAAPDDSDRERSCYGRMRNLKVYSGTLPDDEIITLTSA
jgi:hypothetical protein